MKNTVYFQNKNVNPRNNQDYNLEHGVLFSRLLYGAKTLTLKAEDIDGH